MMQIAARSMMRCLPDQNVPKAHIIAIGNIISVSDIICPTGQTSCKETALSADKSDFFDGVGDGTLNHTQAGLLIDIGLVGFHRHFAARTGKPVGCPIAMMPALCA